MHENLRYVLAAYAVTWTVLLGYAVYLWRLSRHVNAEARACE